MAITKKYKGRFTVLDVDKKNNDPVAEILAALSGIDGSRDNYMLNFTALKPSRFNQGDLEKLFVKLPHNDSIQYYIALPDRMVPEATRMARDYDETFEDYHARPQYRIMTKSTALMMTNQR